jgi:type IV pilus secretin PilQ/predicted competence protein
MNKLAYIKLLVFAVILALGARPGLALAEPPAAEAARNAAPEPAKNPARDAGGGNPFADFFNSSKGGQQTDPHRLPAAKEKPELFLESITLKFLDAKNLADIVANMSSEYGSVTTDAKSNSLIICDTRDRLDKILRQVKEADKPPQEIMIEAVIVDVQLDSDTEIGVNWDLLSSKLYDVTYRQNLGSRLSMVPDTADTRADTTVFNTTSATGIEGGYFALISGTIRNTVHLLQEKKNIEILASPRVMVVSGQSASIETVTEIPYREVTQTSYGGELAATQFKKVGIKLNVTATLTDDNYILVTLEPEQSVDTGQFGTTSEVPIIDTRRAKTTLLLKDGQVVVMGGLRKKETTKQVSQVPLLGDLPVVGTLFRNNHDIVKNSELLVFMSPHIYKNEPLSDTERQRFDQLRNETSLQLPKDGNDAPGADPVKK